MRISLLTLSALVVLGLSSCDNASSKIDSGSSSEGDATEASSDVSVDAVDNAQGTPAFAFDEEAYDFGQIPEGEVAKHDFKFTNSGDAPLIISSASGSCGCTVPQWPREPIAPGETGIIHVEFNSNGRAGSQTKQVTLSANTVPNSKILQITAQVEPKAAAETPAEG